MNINNPTTFGTPNLTLSTSNSSGTGGALRADDTILVYDTTVPTTIASEASANTGDTSTAARRNHTHGMYTVTSQAIQSAIEAETNQDTYIPPDLLKYSPGVAKAWAHITQTGTQALDGSYGVSGITDNAVGNTTITFTVSFSNAFYSQVALSAEPTYVHSGALNGTRVNDTGMMVRTSDNTATDTIELDWAGFGDQ